MRTEHPWQPQTPQALGVFHDQPLDAVDIWLLIGPDGQHL
jgi:hypothetical protein